MLQTTEKVQPRFSELEPDICNACIGVRILFDYLVNPPGDDDAATLDSAIWLTGQILDSTDSLKERFYAAHAASVRGEVQS